MTTNPCASGGTVACATWPSKHDGPCACRFVRRAEFGEVEQVDWCALHAKQREDLEYLQQIETAAKELVARKGRHDRLLAYERLAALLEQSDT